MKLIAKLAEEYYWRHQEVHQVDLESEKLKAVVMACFEDGFRKAREMAVQLHEDAFRKYYDLCSVSQEIEKLGEEEVEA
jgi:hypothetical protein